MPAPRPTRAADPATEALIVSLYASDPSKGFEALHQTYVARIRAYISRMLYGYSVSEREVLLDDIQQETLLALHQRLMGPNGLPPGYDLNTQVFLTCKGKTQDTLRRINRRQKREFLVEPEELMLQAGLHPAPSPEGQVLMQELLRKLDTCLERLTERARVVVLRTSQGYSNRDIQSETGISHEPTVCKTRHNARAKLKECLETLETKAPLPGLPLRPSAQES